MLRMVYLTKADSQYFNDIREACLYVQQKQMEQSQINYRPNIHIESSCPALYDPDQNIYYELKLSKDEIDSQLARNLAPNQLYKALRQKVFNENDYGMGYSAQTYESHANCLVASEKEMSWQPGSKIEIWKTDRGEIYVKGPAITLTQTLSNDTSKVQKAFFEKYNE